MKAFRRKYQVFVSSTFTDLRDERLAAISCIESMGLIAAGMEKFPAGNRHAWDQITTTIDESDYYILVLGSRYGSPGPDLQYSYTEMEYRYALEREMPIAAFVRNSSEHVLNDADPRFSVFKEFVQRRTVRYWTGSDDLCLSIATSVHQLIEDFPSIGWRRPKPRRKIKKAHSDASRPKTRIERVIGKTNWLAGAVNFDEDLHFSSFYLRRSVQTYLPDELKEFGYSKLIAVFDDLNEKYYIPADECRDVAAGLVARMRRDPAWFQESILDEIHVRVVNLESVFSDIKHPAEIQKASIKKLIEWYRAHKIAHERLYEVARIPEALDRGVGYTFSRATEQFDVDTRNPNWKTLLSREMLRRVVAECDRAATLLKSPQDVEWTVKEGALWLLQSRAINAVGSGRHLVVRSRVAAGHGNDIAEICRAYRVPPNLKLHLLRVAAVGEWICQNWVGPAIERERIKRALLRHDIGNIVKADYERNPGLFPEELRNLRYWIAVQENVRRRFGGTDVAASAAIAREIGADESVLRLMEEKQFIHNVETAASPDFNRKIAAYADQRVSPHGIVPLEKRLWEAKERYRNVPSASVNVAVFGVLVEHARAIESQIAELCSRPLSELSDDTIRPIIERLRAEKIF